MNKIHSLMDEDDCCLSIKAFGCQGFMAHLAQKEKSCALHSGINAYIRALHLNIASNSINKQQNNLYCSSSFCYSSQSVINDLNNQKPCYQINTTGEIEVNDFIMNEPTFKKIIFCNSNP